ncbi:Fc receptor-like protein 5 [Sardina pilchardus]|uniref:Fc receptor-like protein 5 n=1 Tax=Sardina pilchardus TaxID=27697 RepID=UPI002E11D74D
MCVHQGPSSGLHIRPSLSISPHSWAVEGDSVTLSCEVTDVSGNWTFLWYQAVKYRVDLPSFQYRGEYYTAELLPNSSRGAGGSYTLSPAPLEETGLYVCRAGRGDPAYQTGFSNVVPLWVLGLSPPASLVIRPNRSQHFTHNSLSLSCEVQDNSTGWTLRWLTQRRERSACPDGWESEAGPTCSTSSPGQEDSGLYWCTSESGRSNAVNITVTTGDVILESPVYPVTEGDPLTLRCLSRNSPSAFSADFYKDGSLLQSQTTGEMTIPAVSKAHEGLYKCRHPELGESPESRIMVISPSSGLHIRPSLSISTHSWTVEGDSVTLSCEVTDASSNWTFLWYRLGYYRAGLPSIKYRGEYYSAELLPDSSRGAGGSYTLSPAAHKHTGLYVCRAEGGEPAYQTDFSNVIHLWVLGLSPPASLVIRPNRTQHFTHNSLSLSCEVQDNSTGWELRWWTQRPDESECPDGWESEAGPTCSTSSPEQEDSGVYWCASESGESNAVNITVTSGDVILESPAHPVTEGDPLTLRCLSRNSPSTFSADFFKDGSLLQSQTTGEMTIPAVSKAHEGLYKCRHTELGESPESRIRVISDVDSKEKGAQH